MDEKQFTLETKLYKAKFKNLKSSIILTDADGELYTAVQGNPLHIIKTLVELAESDPYFMSVFLTVGEYLRTKLSKEQRHGLAKINLKKSLDENAN
jgi:hypothetical protein